MIHWHHPALYVAKSTIGPLAKGCFTKKSIKKNELIWYVEDFPKVTLSQLKILGAHNPDMMYAQPVGKDEYLAIVPELKSSPIETLNHSCDPNIVYLGSSVLLAWKDIPAGGELFYDYGTAENIGYEPNHMDIINPCLCGSKDCRGKVNTRDAKKLVHKYGIYMQKFVLRELNFSNDQVNEYFYD